MLFNEIYKRKSVTKLKELRITRVDLVDKGANPGAFIMIAKAADPEPSHEAQPPDAFEFWQIEAIASEFVAAGADYASALSTVMKDQNAYQSYRRENFR
jgi:hypothetical protein